MKVLKLFEKLFLIAGILHVGFIAYCYFNGYDLAYYNPSKYVTFALVSCYFSISIYRGIKLKKDIY
ncbi:hypothetical protein D7Z54_33470 [Salibacterium salarium]|uniref:Uncharacterized protein n=1 Tax=Salibacterium salarium TaxID=284579 RepID=A0A428MSP0_9BACI|nr:hypothetical protein [Salibacterium salarium]RSL29008.1 hypothetical protein D7Z54_33470 [Salibacterium salarium]